MLARAPLRLASILLLQPCCPLLIPGLQREYLEGEELPMRVAKLMSTRTLVPFSYYSLAQCTPRSLEAAAENLGEVLHGDRIFNAPFELRLRRPRALALCRLLLDPQERELWVARIREGYRAHLLLDNLPVGTRRPRDGAAPLLERGYLLGAAAPDGAIVHNHLHFTVRYHLPSPSVTTGEAWRGSGRRARIVGFEVEPSSRGYTHAARWPDDSEGEARSPGCGNTDPRTPSSTREGTDSAVLRCHARASVYSWRRPALQSTCSTCLQQRLGCRTMVRLRWCCGGGEGSRSSSSSRTT